MPPRAAEPGAGSRNGAIGAGAGSNEAIGAGVGFGARFLALALLAGFAFFYSLPPSCWDAADAACCRTVRCHVERHNRPADFGRLWSSALTKGQDGCAKPKFYSDCKAGIV